MPVSSSSVTKVIPLACPGPTNQHDAGHAHGTAVGKRFERPGRATWRLANSARKERKRMSPQRETGGAVVGQNLFGGRHCGKGDLEI